MNAHLKMFVTAVFCGGIVFNAMGQVDINSSSGPVNISGSNQVKINSYGGLGNSVRLSGYSVLLEGQHISLNPSISTSLNERTDPKTTYNYGNLIISTGTVPGYGNLTFQGQIVGALPKGFIHPHPTDTSKIIRYVAIESGEVLTLARGTAKTVKSEATIPLPEHFAMVTSDKEPISVILSPEGAPVLLYTKQKSRSQIVVAMKKSDFSEFNDVDFSYQVTGIRDGFEKSRVIINETELESPILERDPKTNEVQRRIDIMNKRMNERVEAKTEKVSEVKDEK